MRGDITGIASIPTALLDTAKPANNSKLHQAAEQFEALVIGEMLRSERESRAESSGSGGWLDTGGDSGSESAMDLAEGQLSNALAAGGGLGLAKMIEKTMAQAESPSRATVPASEP
jgi:Rod binding domain-containing protein